MIPPVSNASPLIVLAKADLLEILPKLFPEVLLPAAVYEEILAGDAGDPMRSALSHCPWLRLVQLVPAISPLSTLQLGAGEAEVIEYARLNGFPPVLLDDRAARRAAEAVGLRVHGTLGVVATGAKLGHIESFDVAIAKLRSVGLYVSERLVEEVRKKTA